MCCCQPAHVLPPVRTCAQATTRQALPCAKGTYKGAVSKGSACTPCPAGLTTPSTKSTSASECSIATPGSRPLRVNGVATGVEACPTGTYGTDGIACIACPDGLQTESTACISPAACLAGPGYGYYKTAIGDNNPVTTADLAGAKLMQCPIGSYKVRQEQARC
jgi:hypothetical protein